MTHTSDPLLSVSGAEIPLFPLKRVLFPGGPLPLRVFEPRYLDMVSRCMKADSGFGVVLIKDGVETGPSTTHAVGTLAKITDWYQGSDGILGITAQGLRRYRLLSSHRQSDGLALGNVEWLDHETDVPLPEKYQVLADILQGVLGDLGKHYEMLDKHYDDATWVGCRLAEILPIGVEEKQFCLELNDPIQRLEVLRPLLKSMRGAPQ